jgi:hypothetical protein
MNTMRTPQKSGRNELVLAEAGFMVMIKKGNFLCLPYGIMMPLLRTYLKIPRSRDSGVCGVAQEARSEVWLFQINDERRSDAPQTPCPCGLRTQSPRSALIGLGIATAIPRTSRLDRGLGAQQRGSCGIMRQVLLSGNTKPVFH